MYERKFEIEIKKEIESEIEKNDLIKINLYFQKNKMSIKKRYNNLSFFFYIFL